MHEKFIIIKLELLISIEWIMDQIKITPIGAKHSVRWCKSRGM
jgi:hypothetical protein